MWRIFLFFSLCSKWWQQYTWCWVSTKCYQMKLHENYHTCSNISVLIVCISSHTVYSCHLIFFLSRDDLWSLAQPLSTSQRRSRLTSRSVASHFLRRLDKKMLFSCSCLYGVFPFYILNVIFTVKLVGSSICPPSAWATAWAPAVFLPPPGILHQGEAQQ